MFFVEKLMFLKVYKVLGPNKVILYFIFVVSQRVHWNTGGRLRGMAFSFSQLDVVSNG